MIRNNNSQDSRHVPSRRLPFPNPQQQQQPYKCFQTYSKILNDSNHDTKDNTILMNPTRDKEKQEGKNDANEELTKAWIPPMRPLSGDRGQSHLYDRNTNTQIYSNNDNHNDTQQIDHSSSSIDIHNDIQKDIERDLRRRAKEEGGGDGDDDNGQLQQHVHYIDLDDLDLQELQNLGYIDNQDIINDEDLNELIESLKLEILDHDDDDEEEEEDEYEEYDEECDDDDEEEDDKSMKDQYQHLFDSNKEKSSTTTTSTNPNTAPTIPDWLKTRRQKLQQQLQPGQMMTPSQSAVHIQKQGEIPNIPYTLLSSDEIMTCLRNLGGHNVQLIVPEDNLKQYLGWEGMIIATATSYSHLRVMAEAIVRALRERKLSERGVVGAKFGAEGGEDPTMSARKKSKLGRGSKLDDGWMAVDCRNFIVHVQDEITRRSVDLEGLWSPGSKQGKTLRQLNCKDDDAVDDYVAENPVPSEYSETLMMNTDFWGDGKYRGGMGNPVGVKRGKGRWTSPRDERRKTKNIRRFTSTAFPFKLSFTRQ